jgi:hypothetical protein
MNTTCTSDMNGLNQPFHQESGEQHTHADWLGGAIGGQPSGNKLARYSERSETPFFERSSTASAKSVKSQNDGSHYTILCISLGENAYGFVSAVAAEGEDSASVHGVCCFWRSDWPVE